LQFSLQYTEQGVCENIISNLASKQLPAL